MADIFLILPDALELVPITNLFDAAGEDVDTWEDAVTFVAGPLPNSQWLSAPTTHYRIAAPN